MKKLIIVCAGGFGIEAYDLVLGINKVSPTWNVKGFLSDVPVDLKSKKIDVPILGGIQNWVPSEDEYYVIGHSSPSAKEKIAKLLASRGAKFATLIGSRAYIHETATIGEGCIVTCGSVGRCANLGKFVHICGSTVGGSAVIGDYSTLTMSVNITSAQIGKRVFIGSHAVVLGNAKIGDDAFVCTGSIVFSNVKSGQRVIGYPASRSPFV